MRRLVKPTMSCWIAHVSYPVSQYEWIFHHESIYQKKQLSNLCHNFAGDRILEITEHLIQVQQCMVCSLWLCVTWCCRGLRNAERRPNATCQVNPSNGSQAHPTISSPCLWTFCRWLASGENKNQWKHNCLRLKTTTHLHIEFLCHCPATRQDFCKVPSQPQRAREGEQIRVHWPLCYELSVRPQKTSHLSFSRSRSAMAEKGEMFCESDTAIRSW